MDNPMDEIAAKPTLDELLRKTKAERTPEDEIRIVLLYREKRAALLAKKDADEDGDE